ncbi:uncharacterized protein LOC120266493 [Dioscorea cayenensis subsp. rotundata]|uniref:Uncharacterized protein LOC120266493 n=1 Tax=Dioscorea cayennensis subsp. rotundata TaxID=55577 RepID=A0AB40BRG0_DIOCR|nr:uncharacterized protein LOC120266493 [Dioscorea cayenensis subsp. rotundata]
MRVSFWEFLHCPLICSSKSSFNHCSPQPVGSEAAQVAVDVVEKLQDDDDDEEEEEEKRVGFVLRSSLKKPSFDLDSKGPGKEGVRWMDFMGKELVEVREFEPNESSDSDDEDDNNPACMCVIQ